MTDTEIRQIIADLVERDLLDRCRAQAVAHHVTVHELVDSFRFKPAEIARHALWHELAATGAWGPLSLARVFKRDRWTITRGIRCHEQRLAAAKGAA